MRASLLAVCAALLLLPAALPLARSGPVPAALGDASDCFDAAGTVVPRGEWPVPESLVAEGCLADSPSIVVTVAADASGNPGAFDVQLAARGIGADAVFHTFMLDAAGKLLDCGSALFDAPATGAKVRADPGVVPAVDAGVWQQGGSKADYGPVDYAVNGIGGGAYGPGVYRIVLEVAPADFAGYRVWLGPSARLLDVESGTAFHHRSVDFAQGPASAQATVDFEHVGAFADARWTVTAHGALSVLFHPGHAAFAVWVPRGPTLFGVQGSTAKLTISLPGQPDVVCTQDCLVVDRPEGAGTRTYTLTLFGAALGDDSWLVGGDATYDAPAGGLFSTHC